MSSPPSLAELRGRVGSEDPKSDDACLRRLLVARDNNVEDAHKVSPHKRMCEHLIKLPAQMWLKWVAWRAKFRIDSISADTVANETASGKATWSGKDRHGHPCCVIRPRLHDPKTRDLDQVVQFSVWMLEEGVRLAEEGGTEQVSVLHLSPAARPPPHSHHQPPPTVLQVCVLYDRRGMTLANFDGSLFALYKVRCRAAATPATAGTIADNSPCAKKTDVR
jgi:hypothetical protein